MDSLQCGGAAACGSCGRFRHRRSVMFSVQHLAAPNKDVTPPCDATGMPNNNTQKNECIAKISEILNSAERDGEYLWYGEAHYAWHALLKIIAPDQAAAAKEM